MADAKKDKLQIRNSTVDFLVFTKDAHEDGIEVRVQDHDVWLTQKAIARLFDVDRSVVTKHLKNKVNKLHPDLNGELISGSRIDRVCSKLWIICISRVRREYKMYFGNLSHN